MKVPQIHHFTIKAFAVAFLRCPTLQALAVPESQLCSVVRALAWRGGHPEAAFLSCLGTLWHLIRNCPKCGAPPPPDSVTSAQIQRMITCGVMDLQNQKGLWRTLIQSVVPRPPASAAVGSRVSNHPGVPRISQFSTECTMYFVL